MQYFTLPHMFRRNPLDSHHKWSFPVLYIALA